MAEMNDSQDSEPEVGLGVWGALPTAVAEHVMTKQQRWIANLRLVCKAWCREVDNRVKHVSVVANEMALNEALKVVKSSFHNVTSIGCHWSSIDCLGPISDALGSSLVSLVLQESENQRWKLLSTFTQLESLSVAGGSLECVLFAHLASLPTLTDFTINGSMDRCRGVDGLGALMGLQKLTFGLTDVQDLTFVKPLLNLVELDIHSCKGLRCFSSLSALTNLKKLNVSHTDIDTLDHLEHLLKLSALDVFFCRELTSTCGLSALTNLEELDMSRTLVESLDVLEGLVKLVELDISHCQNLTCFSTLSALTLLRRLRGGRLLHFNGREARHLSGLTNLRELMLPDTPIGPDFCNHLLDLSNLTHLDFYGFRRGQQGAHQVGRFRSRVFRIGQTRRCSDVSVLALGHLTRLKRLIISKVRLSDEDVGVVARITPLTRLDFDASHVTDNGLVNLKELQNLNTMCLAKWTTPEGRTFEWTWGVQVKRLALEGWGWNDDVLKYMGRLRSLNCLFIVTGITSRGIDTLTSLQGLTRLCMDCGNYKSQWPYFPDVLSSLSHLTNLEVLRIDGVAFDGWLANLREALPFCEVSKGSLIAEDIDSP